MTCTRCSHAVVTGVAAAELDLLPLGARSRAHEIASAPAGGVFDCRQARELEDGEEGGDQQGGQSRGGPHLGPGHQAVAPDPEQDPAAQQQQKLLARQMQAVSFEPRPGQENNRGDGHAHEGHGERRKARALAHGDPDLHHRGKPVTIETTPEESQA